jgi:Ca2+-binding EF-hand superfamily protein
MFDKADIDKDGLIRADEFYDVLTKKQQNWLSQY